GAGIMIYKFYRNNQLEVFGSLEEVSAKTGYAPNTIKTLISKPYHGKNGRLRVETIKTKIKEQPKKVRLGFLRKKIKENKYIYSELAELMGLHKNTVSAKMNGKKPFTDNDIAFFEDLFFLNEGELIDDTEETLDQIANDREMW